MSDEAHKQPAGWYYAQGDAPGTQRYWDGSMWQGGPQPVPGGSIGSADTASPIPANPGRRIAARAVDVLVWILIAILVAVPTGLALALSDSDGLITGVGQLMVGVLLVVYEASMLLTRGGTVGKRLFGLAVTSKTGNAVDLQAAVRRTAPLLGYALLRAVPVIGLVLLVVLPLAGFVMILTDRLRQTPWDKLAGTVVTNG